jgi:PKHD-type hydroxylase
MLEFYPCFPTNPKLDLTNYYFFPKGFDTLDIDRILSISELYEFQEAKVHSNGDDEIVDNKIRESSVKWLIPEIDKTEWIYERLMGCVIEANTNLWEFDINHFKDSIQYTEYHGDREGHYDWHIDMGGGNSITRKISIVVQLSDPDEYEGGELQLQTGGDTPTSIIKKKGCVTLFPSYLRHRVTPVTKGVRKSLVLWVGGSTFK